MGTSYTIKITGDNVNVSKIELKDSIELILEEINSEMSTYLPNSSLSRINQNQTIEWQTISSDLYEVIEEALSIGILSNGGFDITIGPLVNLWGFGVDEKSGVRPSDNEILQTMANTGFHNIQLSSNPYSIKKEKEELYVDLSGIAKGYAVDKITNYLNSINISNYMVEIGGEIRARGLNEKDKIWRIGIEQPLTKQRQVQRIIKLDNIAMASSGDYRNYFEEDGVRYSHIINPASGKPVTHNLVAVTVLSESTSTADGLATAMLILGLEEAYKLAEQEDIAAFFIFDTDDGFQEKFTSQFQQYIINE